MRKQILLIGLLGAMLLTGCTKKNIVKSEAEKAVESASAAGVEETVEAPVGGIVWGQLFDDLDEVYTDVNDYPFAGTISAGFYPEEELVRFYILPFEEISKEEAADYATTVIKGMGYLINEQNDSYKTPSEKSYGGFLSQYNIYVMVAPDQMKDDKSYWYLEDTIPKGEYRAVNPEAGVSAD